MEQTKITNYNDDSIGIQCPHCDNWCEHGIDEARKRFASFDVLEWKDDVEGENEHSVMKCLSCKGEFDLEWDYENKES